MISNKKGLSAIVTTMLIVLLVLVAVGIVWAVVSGLLQSGTGEIEIGAKCLNVDVKATSVDCTAPAACIVVVERTGSSSEAIGGIMVVIKDSAAGIGTDVEDEPDNMLPLATKSLLNTIDTTTPVLLANPDLVEVTVYFDDSSGIAHLCPQPSSFSF